MEKSNRFTLSLFAALHLDISPVDDIKISETGVECRGIQCMGAGFFFDAVLKSKNSDLAIKFPKTDEERQRAAASWSLKSNPGGEPVFRRCIGAIDGTIIRINQSQCAPNPRRSEASQERQQDD